MNALSEQSRICQKYGSPWVDAPNETKVGIALGTLALQPINALRHTPESGTSGWFIWGGTELANDPEFFQPLHVSHLPQYVPQMIPFLGLAPGWRVLLAPDREDVWYDNVLIDVAP
jgi:hypothetical protein